MSSHSRHVPGLHADAGLMHADAGPTRAEESTLPAVELFPSGERGSDAHTPHTHAPAVLPQLSSARTPITLPHTHTLPQRPTRAPSFPILGAHTQSALTMSTAQQRAAAAMEQAAAREHEQLMRDETHAAPPHSHAALPHSAEQPDPAEHPHPSGQQVPSPQGTNSTPPPMRAHVSAPPNSDPRHLHPIHVNNINNQGLEQRMERRLRDVSARLEAVNQVQTEETQSLRDIVHDVLAKLAFFTDATHRKEEAVRIELEHFKAYITSRVRELRAEQDRLGNFAAALTASTHTPPATLEAALTQHREQLLEAFAQQLRQELSALATHLCTEQVPDPVVEAEVAAEAAEAERLEHENEEFRRALAERERVNAQSQPKFIKHAPPPPPPPIAQPYATHIPPLFPQPTIPPPPPTQQPTPAALAPAPVPAAAWLPPPPPMPALDNPGLQVSDGVNVAKFMHKPAAFAGNPGEDVDNALFAIEMYLATARIPVHCWATVATSMVKGQAFQAWINVVHPLKRAHIEPTWAHFCTCLRDAFGSPDKELNARKAFRSLRQKHMSALEYVRYARSLLAQLVSSPPSEADKTVALFEGLNQSVKQAAPVDPRTGRAWRSFDDLAAHLITLEAQVPPALKQAERSPDFLRRNLPRKPFTPTRTTFAAPIHAPKTLPPPRDPRLLPHPGAGRGGGRTGGGRGTGYFNQPPYKRVRQERQPGSRSDMSASLAALSAQNRELKEQIASSQKN